jgi:trk system potassium uptake protein TrkH
MQGGVVSRLSEKLYQSNRALRRATSKLYPRSPGPLLVASFAYAIGVGTLLLWLPFSHYGKIGLIDALFTATSAVCVTGLVVVKTGVDFTPFGQGVILLLIQAGGLGVMSFAAIGFRILGKRLSLGAKNALTDTLFQKGLGSELKSTFRRIMWIVAAIEGAGALLLFAGMFRHHTFGHAAWSAVFHSVSAFCNAGFTLYPTSLIGFRLQPLVVWTVMVLIVMGGIGHPVLVDLWNRLTGLLSTKPKKSLARLSLNSRVALLASGGLILGGAAVLAPFGMADQVGGMSELLQAALFQSVTARTAGFNTVVVGALPLGSLFLLMLLMFIGGSAGSCAGGIKTTTFTVWAASLYWRLRGRKHPRLLGRHIPGEIARRGSMIIGLAVVWNLVGVLALSATEQRPSVGLEDILFEQISAFGTVGLSTGLTPKLSIAGRLWIAATMFAGRVGPLTLAMLMLSGKAPSIRYPEGRVMIG